MGHIYPMGDYKLQSSYTGNSFGCDEKQISTEILIQIYA